VGEADHAGFSDTFLDAYLAAEGTLFLGLSGLPARRARIQLFAKWKVINFAILGFRSSSCLASCGERGAAAFVAEQFASRSNMMPRFPVL